MQQIKANSSRWINEQGFCAQKFEIEFKEKYLFEFYE
jgi:hypothetical protein